MMLRVFRSFGISPGSVAGLLAVALTAPSPAQQALQRHSFSIGGGAAVPGRDLKTSMSSAFQLRVGYGYRFLRHFQADLGLNVVTHAAGVKGLIESPVGESKIRDYEYLVPFGARAVLPLAHGRFEIHGGGGGAYLRYQEEASVPSGVNCYGNCTYDIQCPTCTSRNGWGHYASAGAAAALDRGARFWLGVSTQVFRGKTSGESLGSVPGIKTSDTWVVATIDLTGRI